MSSKVIELLLQGNVLAPRPRSETDEDIARGRASWEMAL